MEKLMQFKINKLLLPLILTTTIILPGCNATLAAAGITMAGVGGYLLGQDKRDVKTLAKDTEIKGQINNALFADPIINPFNVNVSVKNGVVLLKGKVPSEGVAQRVVQISQHTPNVTKVITRLKIDPPDQYIIGVEDDQEDY